MKKIDLKLMLFVVAFLGMISVVAIFLPSLKSGDDTINGLSVAFGKTSLDMGAFANVKIKMNIFAVVGYILPIAAAIYALVVKRLDVITFVLFLVSMVALIVVPSTTQIEVTTIIGNNTSKLDANMAIGLILAIAASAINTVVSLIAVVNKIK